jgi:hypothetical protein
MTSQEADEVRDVAHIRKPFTLAELLEAVHRCD